MPTVKKSQELIDAIAADIGTMSQAKIAKKHGVSQGFVSKVKGGNAVADVVTVKEHADPTNEKILKLEAQNVALSDQVRRCKLAYKAAQRDNSVFEALVDEMHAVVKPVHPLPAVTIVQSSKKLIKETLVANLSDEHADSIILPHQVGGLERFDFRIACRRAEEYVDTLLKFTKNTLANYDFPELIILANGDHVSGDIHGATDHSAYRNSFKNAFAVGQLHSLMLRDLAPHFEKIKILYLPGNHGRRTQKKDYHGAHDNWDYLVAQTALMTCSNMENVEFLIPDSFSACLDIEGYGFYVSHGDDVRSWNGIPWYGIERKTRRLMALSTVQNRQANYFCFAHFHSPATQDAVGGEVIINGSWTATSPYAYESLSVANEPSQWIFGVHKDRGISWRLKMLLRTEKEHLGPNRYHVNIPGELE
jgi:hypothetical protein